MKILRKIIPIVILFLLSSPILLLQGCGDKPPYGSTVTVDELGSLIYSPTNPASDVTNATKTQYYRVTVLDPDGLPMNGIKVDVFGTIGSNSVIDSFGPTTGTAFNDKTGDWGFFDFAIVAHVYRPLTFDYPSSVTTTGSTSSGSLSVPDGGATFCYQVTAIDASTPVQETGPSTPATCATIDNTTGSAITATVTIAWSAVYGASGYRVYRSSTTTAITTGLIGSTTTALTFPDSGITATGSVPTGGPVTTTTGNNSISGTITVTSGASIGTVTIGF